MQHFVIFLCFHRVLHRFRSTCNDLLQRVTHVRCLQCSVLRDGFLFTLTRVMSLNTVTCPCVCVYHLNRCNTSIICRGPLGSRGGRWPTKTPPRDPCKRTCMQWPWTATPSVGAVAGHCSDSPWAPSCAAGMSQYIYIYTLGHQTTPVRFSWVVFARPMHSTSVIR